MDIASCICGESRVRFEGIGRDYWIAKPKNLNVKIQDNSLNFFCRYCGARVSKLDPYMIANTYALLEEYN
jgi:hypothetical protein